MILDYLRRAGRWTLLLVLLPVLCAATAFWLNRNPPQVWSASATILTAPTATGRTGAQYVNDVQAALLSDAVVGQVAKQTKASPDTIRSGLTSAILAPGSSLLQVSFTASEKSVAAAVPATAARVTLQNLLSPTLAANAAQLKVTEDQLELVVQARDEYIRQIGVVLPVAAYQSALGELGQLRANAVTAHAQDRPGAAELDALVKSRQAAVAALGPQAVHFQDLQGAVDRASGEVSQARASVISSQAQVAALDSPATIKSTGAYQLSSNTQLLQRVLGAAVVGAIFAVLILAGLLTLSRRRARRSPAPRATPVANEPLGRPSPRPRSAASNTELMDSARVTGDSAR